MRWAHFSDKESNIYFWNEKFYNWLFLEEKSTCGFKEAFVVTHLNFFLNGSLNDKVFGEIKKKKFEWWMRSRNSRSGSVVDFVKYCYSSVN